MAALGAPRWHGGNINALIDSMIYGGINEIEPPLTIRITGIKNLMKDAGDELALVVGVFAKHQGADTTLEFQLSA